MKNTYLLDQLTDSNVIDLSCPNLFFVLSQNRAFGLYYIRRRTDADDAAAVEMNVKSSFSDTFVRVPLVLALHIGGKFQVHVSNTRYWYAPDNPYSSSSVFQAQV